MAGLEWPADLGHGTFVGRFGFMDADGPDPDRSPDLSSATGGTVRITPSVQRVRYANGPLVLVARSATGVIDSEGYLCTPLADGKTPGPRGMVFPATDDEDLNPSGWSYEIAISLNGGVKIPPFHVELPQGETVDLAKAAPVPATGGTAKVIDTTTAERAEAAAAAAEALVGDGVGQIVEDYLEQNPPAAGAPTVTHLGDGLYEIGA